jgi:hypothetical protein
VDPNRVDGIVVKQEMLDQFKRLIKALNKAA